jgi:diguanylate cyclase
MDTLLTQLSSSVSSARTLEDLTRPMLEMLEAVTGLESTYLTRIDLEQGLQHILYARNARQLQIPEGLAVPWGDTLCKRALDEGRVYTDNVAECWGDSDAARQLGIQTYVSTPVRTDSGGLYGTLCAASGERQPLPANATNVLGLFARLIGHQVEREQLFQRLSAANAELATHAATDALTGLPNRRAFLEGPAPHAGPGPARRHRPCWSPSSTSTASRRSTTCTATRPATTSWWRSRAGCTARCAPATCWPASAATSSWWSVRAPALAGGESPAAAEALGQRVAAATVGHFHLGAVEIGYGGASVGAVAVDPRFTTAEEALRLADAAMYLEKRGRSGRPHG